MKLAIISHTEHYTTSNGTLVGWSPTVNEINHLLEVFDNIVHLAMHYEGAAPPSTMAYKSEHIQFIALPSVGGPRITDKLKIVVKAPNVIRLVSKALKQVDYFQLRTPTGIGVFLIPFLTLFSKRLGWYKYAGNWNQKHPPMGYALQRWMLQHQSRKVTINGRWPNQPKQCLSFENPCLTDEDLEIGLKIGKEKTIVGPLTLCFVGRMEEEKGVGRILEALELLTKSEQQRISMVHLVGEGKALADYKLQAKSLTVPIRCHGSLSRNALFEIFKISHAIMMPTTASEGFPKVLAEAMAFGCVPLVSNISSIGQYIGHQEQGLLLDTIDAQGLAKLLHILFNLDQQNYLRMLSLQKVIVQQFTFAHYHQQLKNLIVTVT